MDLRVKKVMQRIEESLQDGIDLREIAREVNLSPSRLRCLFKSQTGTTPAQYLKTARMNKAKELLESSFLHVKEVMRLVGVHDPSHFVREFKSIYGLPPGKYRARLNGGSNGRGVESPDNQIGQHLFTSANK